ncbi:hypothetical protein ABMA28_010638 [Loxostege sticticalis]|uniref:Uncharacterized protein n=1 Tax=Loxostege sticticalis TaxID=481309 RepID=A0ABD0S901_LOXSC
MEEYIIVLPQTSEDLKLVTETDDELLPKEKHISIDEDAANESCLIKNLNIEELDNVPHTHKKWDVTSRKQLKTKRHPVLIANNPNASKKSFDKLSEAKLELVLLQKQLLEAEIIERKKEWEFNERERKWKEEEYKLKLDKLKKEINE